MEVVSYHTAFKVFANEGATVTTNAEGIWVENAEWVNLIMAANTDYDATKAGCVTGASADDLAAASIARIDAAAAQSYETLLANHTACHAALMNRVDFQIGKVPTDMTTQQLIDFYATWCGPCKMMAPRVEQMAEKYDGKVDVYKVDVDKEEELAAMFGIRSIPSLLFIPMKGEPQMSVGAMSSADLDSAVANLLK